MLLRARLLLAAALTSVMFVGCRDIDPGVTERHIGELETALQGIVAHDSVVSWRSIGVESRGNGEVRIAGGFWARMKKQSVRLAHEFKATFDASSSELIRLTIDGVPFSEEQTLSRWWDGIEEYNPEAKFDYLSEAGKNQLWWEINQTVVREHRESSTTLKWPMHELIMLTNKYDATPLDLSEFFEVGHQATWRTEEAPQRSETVLTVGPERNDLQPVTPSK